MDRYNDMLETSDGAILRADRLIDSLLVGRGPTDRFISQQVSRTFPI